MSILLLLLALLFGVFALGSSSSTMSDRSALESRYSAKVPQWAHQEGFVGNHAAVRGAHLFADSGCLTCHTYLGDGAANLGAPDHSEEGKKGRGVRFQVAHLRCPSCTIPGSQMPSFKALGPRDLRLVAQFLEVSKGPV